MLIFDSMVNGIEVSGIDGDLEVVERELEEGYAHEHEDDRVDHDRHHAQPLLDALGFSI